MKRPTYDLNKAKQLLAEAGYPQGFTIHFDSSVGMFFREKEATEALLNQWAKVGVKLEVDYLQSTRWLEKLFAGKSGPVMLIGWNSAPVFDAEFPLSLSTCVSARKLMCNKPFDDLFYKQQQALDPEERKKLIWQAAEVLCDEALHIPLYEQPSIVALVKGLGNVTLNPEYSMYLHKATMS